MLPAQCVRVVGFFSCCMCLRALRQEAQTAIESYAASFSSANELDINQQTAQGLPVVEFSKGKKPGVQLDRGLVAGTVIKHAAAESPLHNFVDYQLPG